MSERLCFAECVCNKCLKLKKRYAEYKLVGSWPQSEGNGWEGQIIGYPEGIPEVIESTSERYSVDYEEDDEPYLLRPETYYARIVGTGKWRVNVMSMSWLTNQGRLPWEIPNEPTSESKDKSP